MSGRALAAGSSLHCERQGASRRFFLTIRLAPRLHHRLPYPRAAIMTNNKPNKVTGSAAGSSSSSGGKGPFPYALFLTWTTYGAWLPGDHRGWQNWKRGERLPQPLLEDWCRGRMKEQTVVLTNHQRQAVDGVIREHTQIRGLDIACRRCPIEPCSYCHFSGRRTKEGARSIQSQRDASSTWTRSASGKRKSLDQG